ncbi:N-acetylmuramoyl-L-alanine amidase [Paracrocinitomix mangrovi]|uniref:N-acetylmuramoyl-L-alanine amidase n=1 Tax=Paracrocinitomix mangrovi TaxID=2862509 RepID=UPI001C8DA768|nr:N-acetylmuramoyl-L-alanine amidase [Paracrocinitomix mangrovi]UKN00355.1 N-acetylmuramoyl-L-alanine amidase [Paracrocinitomix mangrovi]
MKYIFTILCFTALLVRANDDQVSILIDPGHGGKDPGHLPHVKNGLQEKVLTLKIAEKVGFYLTHNIGNVKVGYTRTDDSYPTLDERVEMANNGYDYMLSIHINGSTKDQISGTETIIHNYAAKTSYKWAQLIEDQFKSRAGRHSRGVKTSDDLGHSLQVLKFTKIPTVVVECGFITNSTESAYLATDYGQDIIASAIFRATRSFVKTQHPKIDFSVKELQENVVKEEGKNEAFYRVQIMSSKSPIEPDDARFKCIDYEVERVMIETSSNYKYRYYVGKYNSKKDAKPVRKDVQDKGFKDAFITYV